MSEENSPSQPQVQPQTGWVRLYHSSGALVTLPVPCDVRNLDCYAAAFAAVSDAVAAGFTVAAPGLEDGEYREQIGYVVRRSKDNERDNTVTPVLDLYPASDAARFACLTVYLNRPEDVAAFEAASGMRLDSLPVYIGDNKIERGKKKDTDRLVVRAPRPFGVVMIANPKYSESEAAAAKSANKMYTVPKRRFVRWEAQAASHDHPSRNGAVPGTVNTQSKEAVHQPTVEEFARVLASSPSLDALNALLKNMNGLDKYTWRAVWRQITEYAGAEGYEFDDASKRFVAPVEVPQDSGQEIPF